MSFCGVVKLRTILNSLKFARARAGPRHIPPECTLWQIVFIFPNSFFSMIERVFPMIPLSPGGERGPFDRKVVSSELGAFVP